MISALAFYFQVQANATPTFCTIRGGSTPSLHIPMDRNQPSFVTEVEGFSIKLELHESELWTQVTVSRGDFSARSLISTGTTEMNNSNGQSVRVRCVNQDE